ncbi:MAG: putative DNA binding domain-containing protein [Polyangiaceae bacterium]|nr:putative DNA binding domain-containing protein [Polyangiaceae bacterium]
MSGEHGALLRLIQSEEGQYFERKSLFQGPPGQKRPRDRRSVRDEAALHVAAFANADGGTLVLGVEDDGVVTGCPYQDDKDLGKLLAAPETRLDPPLAAGKIARLGEVKVVLFEVAPAARAVMVRGDGFPRREGDTVIQSSEVLINATKDAGLVASPEARAAKATVADLSVDALRLAMDAAAFEGDPAEYLVARRLADPRGGTLTLRQGAVWLFAKSPTVIEHPNAGVRVFRVHGTAQTVGASRNVQDFPWIEGSLISVLERAQERIASLVRASSRLHDLFFRETPEYPPFAWQEALVNALAHRDYAIEGRCTEVWLYDDRMEIKSPGGLLAEVTVEALLERRRVHASRNPRIARVLTEQGIMRQQGEGIPRMIEEMELSWLPPPEIVGTPRELTVTLRNEPIFDTSDRAWTRYVRNLPLEVRQKRALVAFADRAAFSSSDYQTLNRVDRDVAYRELTALEERGMVRARGATRGRQYEVVKPRAAAPGAEPTPAARLVERMRAAGRITNADYREAFGVERDAARSALAAWVAGGVLELRGERRGAHYVAGAAWPPK